MSNSNSRTETTVEQVAARHLYEAEVALHIAHQSHVDAWIAAAADRLHDAVVEHLRAVESAHHGAAR